MDAGEREQLEQQAKEGNAHAAYRLGVAYATGDGVPQDYLRAAQYFVESGNQGHGDAVNDLALLYYNGHGVEQNLPHAFKLVEIAAQRGNVHGMFNAGLFLESGIGTEVNVPAAREWMARALQAGHPQAAEALDRIQAHDPNDTRGGGAPPPPPPPPVAAPPPAPSSSGTVKKILAAIFYAVVFGAIFFPVAKQGWGEFRWKEARSRAQHLAQQGRYEEALKKIRSVEIPSEHSYEAAVREREIKEAWAAALLAAGDGAGAGRLYEELQRSADAGAAFESAGAFEDAARNYAKDKPDKASEMYRRAGKKKEAVAVLVAAGRPLTATEYEEGEMWALAAAAHEKAMTWDAALRMFRKAGDARGEARVLERLSRWSEAGAAYERVAAKDRDVGVRISAATAYERAGNVAKSRSLYGDALGIAREFSNFEKIIEIRNKLGDVVGGIEEVLDLGDRLAAREEVFEAEEAYDEAARHLRGSGSLPVTTHNRLVARINAANGSLAARIAAYPKLETIEGVNHYMDSRFTHTEIKGTLRNTTGRPVSAVSIRIKLFQKSLSGMWNAPLPGSIDASMSAYDATDAGRTELVTIRNLAPGELRTFSQRLGNGVPYQYFNYPMTGLSFAP